MDIYSISFLISTLWIGPFWFAMMINPYSEKTNKLLNKPLFFLGPIIIWFLIMLLNPSGLIDFFNSASHPQGFFVGLAKGLSTKAGVTAMWAHMVAGDIFATRWIWQNSIKNKDTQVPFIIEVIEHKFPAAISKVLVPIIEIESDIVRR